MKSLSEIETTTKRASKAMGFSWGVAEEIAKSIRLLELFGFPGIKNLNSYYQDRTKKNYENLTSFKKDNKSNKSSFCPITLGVSFLDQIRTLETMNKFLFNQMSYPLLFLPFLSRGSEIIGKKILLRFDDYEFLLNFNVNISTNFLKKDFPSIAKNTEVNFLENEDSFTEKEWQNLYKLSENTFVEETDSLKKGAAGAGLTDND
tara:strand:- start:832 stop:1443 length:612 start_codon:yes stop_codon:yes gene_type:complete